MQTLTLTLAIEPAAAGYVATLTAELPAGDARLAAAVPLTLRPAALHGLEELPDAYGAALTAMAFPPALREAWARGTGAAEGKGLPLRLRLALAEADDALQALLWETLHDPLSGLPLARGEGVRMARVLPSASLLDLKPAALPALRAVVAISAAAPVGVPPVDHDGLLGATLAGLAALPRVVLDGREGRAPATLPNLAAALRDGPALLVLICHGALVAGEPYLWMEQGQPGPYRPVHGKAFAAAIAQLERPPLLVVLAACQSGGAGDAVLRAVGPELARVGVGAVLAMREQIPQASVAALLPQLLAELRRDGQIDRALAAARAALGEAHPWWLPVLWMRSRDGRLWRDAAAEGARLVTPGTVQIINVSGGSVGSIVGSQTIVGGPPPTPPDE